MSVVSTNLLGISDSHPHCQKNHRIVFRHQFSNLLIECCFADVTETLWAVRVDPVFLLSVGCCPSFGICVDALSCPDDTIGSCTSRAELRIIVRERP